MKPHKSVSQLTLLVLFVFSSPLCFAQQKATKTDSMRAMQLHAIETEHATWGHWGDDPSKYSSWTKHSNRLVPIYTFGMDLKKFSGENSAYRNKSKITSLYGRLPDGTLDPAAEYLDQTDVYYLQRQALAQGKKYIFLIVFDGMDWQTTRAAAIYRNKKVTYHDGRGNGLSFQDYDGAPTDYGYFVCSPYSNSAQTNVDAQLVQPKEDAKFGGYNPKIGGYNPWDLPESYQYLLTKDRGNPDAYTDSAASATSMTSGIKTYSAAINVLPNGRQTIPLARTLQSEHNFATGIVSNVPFCHATPASAYANNVTRNDYQDIGRDMLGLPSIANRKPLPGLDVVLGCGWGELKTTDEEIKIELEKQGANFLPGNKYLSKIDLNDVDINHGGKYEIALRQKGEQGTEILEIATRNAIRNNTRLFGFFGGKGGHLPYATADGDFKPTRGADKVDVYKPEDLKENPSLAEMTGSAISVLSQNENGFWLLVEAGDVDWANHNNNIDDAIGAVFSGEAAFDTVVSWIEENNNWDESAIILTADHGHLFIIDEPEALIPK